MLNSKVKQLKTFFSTGLIIGLVLSLAVGENCFAKEAELARFSTAVKAFSDGFYDAALSLLERFIQDFPESPLVYKARLYLAKSYYYQKNYPEVLKILSVLEAQEQAKEIWDEIYYWLSLIHLMGKDFKPAANYAKRIIDNYPASEFRWPGYYLLGRSFQASGDLKTADEVYLTIIKAADKAEIIEGSYQELFQIYLSQNNYAQLINLAEEYLKKFSHGRQRGKAHFYLGQGYYAGGDLNKAQANYQQALIFESDADFRDLVYQALGSSYLGKGENLQAKVAIDKIKDKELRLYTQGTYYFKLKDYLQALETFNMFIRDYPKNQLIPQAYLGKADILYELGRLNDAIYLYKYILDNFSAGGNLEIINKAHYGLAWSYLKNGAFKKAIDEFKNTLEYAANPVVKVSAQIHIADAYQETGKYQEALDIYSEILESYPNTVYADYIQFQIGLTFLKKKDLEKAFLALKNLTNNFPSSKLISQGQYYLAVGYFSQEDYAAAENLLEDFIKKFPRDNLIAKAYYLYGKCLFNQKKYREALQIFKKVAGKFHDRDIEELLQLDMGITYLQLSVFENAKKLWGQFLKKYPQSEYRSSVELYLGGLYEKEGNYIEAEKYYAKVLNDRKGSWWEQEAKLALGHLYWISNDLEKADEYLQSLAKNETPLAAKAKLYLAKIFAEKQKHDPALAIYDELIKTETAVAKVAYLEKAFLLKQMKHYPDAIAMFERVIALELDNPEVHFSLGLCLEKTGRIKEAVEEYFKVIYSFTESDQTSAILEDKDYKTKSFFRIARIYEREDNIAEAKKIYQKIIDLGIEESKIAQTRLKELEGK